MFNKKNSTGMTLLELLLALALSVFMTSTIFEIYLIAENSRLVQTALITLQENAQTLNQIFKHQLKESAYFGCAKLTEDFPFKNHLPFILNQKNKIQPYQDAEAKAGTDGIRIWHPGVHQAILLKNMRGYSILYVSSNIPIDVDDNLIISDCKTAETFRVKEVSKQNDGTQKISSTEPLIKLYEKNSAVNMLEMESYYIGLTEANVDALFSKDIHGFKTELIDGVSQMKIFFSTIEDNKLVEHPINELTDSSAITGVSFVFDLSENHKNWNLYVALS